MTKDAPESLRSTPALAGAATARRNSVIALLTEMREEAILGTIDEVVILGLKPDGEHLLVATRSASAETKADGTIEINVDMGARPGSVNFTRIG